MASSGIVPSNEALPISALVRPGQLALGMKYAKSSRTVSSHLPISRKLEDVI